ncbi:MAG: class B sortase [Oscillospiraceae bacterium]|nr:class B sortase [Oscillospiraceae bacterium]
MKKSKVTTVLIVVLSLIMLGSVFMIGYELLSRQNDKNEFDKLAELVEETASVSANEEIEKENNYEKDISMLFKQNADFVGWLTIPDSEVNYPVMHTPKNPEKYLRKNFNGKYSMSGVPFVDYRCKLDSGNIIIYGHNMNNNTMFAHLVNYLNNDYKNSHQTILFQTKEELREYSVIEVRKTDIYDTIYNNLYSEMQDVLILSTCYGKKEERLMVIAKRIK